MGQAKSSKTRRASESSIKKKIETLRLELAESRNTDCYLLVADAPIRSDFVDKIFDELKSSEFHSKKLAVVIDSGGGDIHAAYNLAQLFRQYGKDRLTFIIPRWAKSAATLLICGGNEILMTPVAEIGPLDPQINVTNPFEKRAERFSPLHIESTLQLIRDEFDSGNKALAEGLLNRLQYPMTLGNFKKSLDLGKDYLEKLLTSRMLKDDNNVANKIATSLTMGYADHGWCIKADEARELGLKVEELTGKELDIVWDLHKLHKELNLLKENKTREKNLETLKELPPELLKDLPGLFGNLLKTETNS